MGRLHHCPEGCIYCKKATLFAWRCLRTYDEGPTWTVRAPLLKTIDDKPGRKEASGDVPVSIVHSDG
jgi:hypothetical protein